jgi:hypothetical protein
MKIKELDGKVVVLKIIGCDAVPLSMTVAGRVRLVAGNYYTPDRVWVGEFSVCPDATAEPDLLNSDNDDQYVLHTSQYAGVCGNGY